MMLDEYCVSTLEEEANDRESRALATADSMSTMLLVGRNRSARSDGSGCS